MTAEGGAGRALPPTSTFAGDDGSAPEPLAAALALPLEQERLEAVVEALRRTRVLVPVVARLDERDEPGEHGIAGEKSAHAAMVSVAVPDGRAALPVFSSLAALQAWRAQARPVPVEGRRAALAAGSDADGLLVLDPGAAVTVQVPRPAVRAIALGEPWVPAVRNGRLAAAIQAVLSRVPGVVGARVEPGGRSRSEICVAVMLRRHPIQAPDPQTAATLAACREALAASQVVVDLVDSMVVRPAITH